MDSWNRLGLAPTNRPSIAELASDAFGIDVSKSLRNEPELSDALISECIRIGLSLFCEEEESVFNLRLRHWVSRKLGSIMPERFMTERPDYREILEKLEFLGDVMLHAEGYLGPGPTFCVQTGDRSYVLVSRHPTRAFKTIGEKIKITRFGRRLEGADDRELTRLGIAIIPINSYLNFPNEETPQKLISRILSTSRQQALVNPIWDVYKDGRGSYGFYWNSYSERKTNLIIAADFEGMKLSLLREPIGQNYWHYWLCATSGSEKWFHTVDSQDWKRVCLALDYLAGRPREVTVIGDTSDSEFRLLINFPLFKAFFRWLNVAGGRFLGRKSGWDEWELPVSGLELTKKLLEGSGVNLHLKKKGDGV